MAGVEPTKSSQQLRLQLDTMIKNYDLQLVSYGRLNDVVRASNAIFAIPIQSSKITLDLADSN